MGQSCTFTISNRCGHFDGIDFSTRNMLLQKAHELINVLPITLIFSGIDKNRLYSYHNLLRFVWTFLVECVDKHISETRAEHLDRGHVLSDKSPYETKIFHSSHKFAGQAWIFRFSAHRFYYNSRSPRSRFKQRWKRTNCLSVLFHL
jgi:hypothetical protein